MPVGKIDQFFGREGYVFAKNHNLIQDIELGSGGEIYMKQSRTIMRLKNNGEIDLSFGYKGVGFPGAMDYDSANFKVVGDSLFVFGEDKSPNPAGGPVLLKFNIN